jgi:hypothetical protein
VADENIVLDRDAFTNEGVARDLATLANGSVLLDLDKGTNLRFITDFASVKIDELGQLDVSAQLHVRRDAYMWIHELKWLQAAGWILILETTEVG